MPLTEPWAEPFILDEIDKRKACGGSHLIRAHGLALLDEVQAAVADSFSPAAVDRLFRGLDALRRAAEPASWTQFAREDCLGHPLRALLHQDPFTRHAFEKPRGYAGDAHLIDYIYGDASLPAGTSDLGAAVCGYTRRAPAARSVLARRDVLAAAVDEVADAAEHPRVLSVACGHLREAQRSRAVQEGRVGEYVGVDQDPESVARVNAEQAHAGAVRALVGSVRGILSGQVELGGGFDLAYAAGLYDYLSAPTAARLTERLFDMLNPGGRLLVANFAPRLPDIGYMESFMGWDLTYREEAEVAALASQIDPTDVEDARTFWEPNGNVVFLELVRA